MKRTYSCPRCQATLNPNVKVILSAVRDGRRGLVLLSPQPGNYNAIVPEDLGIEPGDLVEFRCPVCNALLTSSENENLALLRFRFSTGLQGTVLFSRRYGEHATYFISD
ncbi:MAG: hypothetical protein JXB39_12515, partial [Deltaproteobacteria bacterium]|nr:hypothetical protein [Deltaproteobacteria bacterium]